MLLTFILLFIAGFLNGIIRVVYKTLAVNGNRSTTLTTVTQLIGAVFAIPLLFINFQISTSPAYWILIGFSVISYALFVTFTFRALQNTDVSLVSIIDRLNIVFIAIAGIAFLGEHLTVLSYAGLALICVGGFIVVFEKMSFILSSGVIFALLATLFGAMASVLDKVILRDFSPYTYVFINDLLVGSVFVSRKGFIPDAQDLLKKHSVKIVLVSLMATVSFAIVLAVLKHTNVSVSVPIYKSFSLLTPVVFGILFLHETKRVPQKILGMFCALLGIILLYL